MPDVGLTEEQIRVTVDRLWGSDDLKAKLAERAIAGEPEARFVVYAAWQRQQKREEGG